MAQGRSPTVAEQIELRRLRHAIAADAAQVRLYLQAQTRDRERQQEQARRMRLAEIDRRLQEQAPADLFNVGDSFDA
jgi:hypothetical protein